MVKIRVVYKNTLTNCS